MTFIWCWKNIYINIYIASNRTHKIAFVIHSIYPAFNEHESKINIFLFDSVFHN